MTARYEIIRQIASGGMAEVLLARRFDDDGNAQHVVLKRVLPHLSNESAFLEMFGREARLASELRHPNIVRVLEVGELDGLPFIAMERLEGADLLRLLQQCALRRQPLGTAVALALVAGAARGLGYAHRARGRDGRALRIIHRDVSPHNLFVTREGGVKLLDFGIAKSASHVGLTGTGQVKGKISYISPEQIRARPIDHRSDLWSLGVVLWEAVAGEKLFTRDNDAATLHAILQDPVPPLMRAEAPGLDELIAAILQRDPDHRVGTAEEIAGYLDAILASMRVTQPERVLAQRVAALIPATDPAREFAKPAPLKQSEVILASSRAAAPQRAMRADTHPPALFEDKTQTEVGFDQGEHTTAVETSIPDDERTVAMSIPVSDLDPTNSALTAPALASARPVRHPRLSLEEPVTTPARRAPTMSMPPVGRRAVEPQKPAPSPPRTSAAPLALPPERPSGRPPPTLPPERKRTATAVPAEPPRTPVLAAPVAQPPPPRTPEPPPMAPPPAPMVAPMVAQRPAPQDDPFGPLPFASHPPQPMAVPVIAPVMLPQSPSSFAPHSPSGAPMPRGDTLAAAEIPRMMSVPPARPKSRGTGWMIGVGGVCLLGSALLLGTMARTPAAPAAAAATAPAVATAAVAAPAPVVAAPAPVVAAPAPVVAAPAPVVAAPAPVVAAPAPVVAAPAPVVAAPAPVVAAPAPVVAAPAPVVAAPAPVVAAPAPVAPPAPVVAAAPTRPAAIAARPQPAAPVVARPQPAAPAARPSPAGLAPDPFATRVAAAPAPTRPQPSTAAALPDPFAPRPVAARPQPAAAPRASSPVPLDLLPPRPAATANRRPPRVVDRMSGLTNDPFDTVHNTAPTPVRAAPAPTRAAPAPSARGSQIFTDL